jgi:hypothetical protein
MIKISDFDNLLNKNSYPSVSILLPTHTTAPDNLQDPILLKNLISEAETRLNAEFNKKDSEVLIHQIKEIAKSINHTYNSEALAIYVNKEYSTFYKLPFKTEPRVIIDSTFATRDLIKTLNRGISYYVLSLSNNEAKLYEGFRDSLTESIEEGFPFTNEIKNNNNPSDSFSIDNQTREFFNKVDKAFSIIYKNHNLPLVLLSAERNIAFYKEIADHNHNIIAEIHGNFINESAHDLGKKIWQEVSDALNVQRLKWVDALAQAVNANKFAQDINEIYKAAKEGRAEVLLVEEGFSIPGKIDDNNNLVVLDSNHQKDANVIDDIIDEIAEIVTIHKGKVVFLPPNSLEKYNKVALITRY